MTHFSSLESQYSYSESCKHFCRPLGYQNIWQLVFSDWNWNLLTRALKEVLLKTPAYEEAAPVDPIILETATSAEARKHLKYQELTWEGFRTVWPPRRVFILPLGPTTSILATSAGGCGHTGATGWCSTNPRKQGLGQHHAFLQVSCKAGQGFLAPDTPDFSQI